MSEAREKLVKEIRDTAFDCFEFIGAGGKYLGCAAIDGLPLTPNDVAQIKQELVEGFNNYAAAGSRLALAREALISISKCGSIPTCRPCRNIADEALAKIQDTAKEGE